MKITNHRRAAGGHRDRDRLRGIRADESRWPHHLRVDVRHEHAARASTPVTSRSCSRRSDYHVGDVVAYRSSTLRRRDRSPPHRRDQRRSLHVQGRQQQLSRPGPPDRRPDRRSTPIPHSRTGARSDRCSARPLVLFPLLALAIGGAGSGLPRPASGVAAPSVVRPAARRVARSRLGAADGGGCASWSRSRRRSRPAGFLVAAIARVEHSAVGAQRRDARRTCSTWRSVTQRRRPRAPRIPTARSTPAIRSSRVS